MQAAGLLGDCLPHEQCSPSSCSKALPYTGLSQLAGSSLALGGTPTQYQLLHAASAAFPPLAAASAPLCEVKRNVTSHSVPHPCLARHLATLPALPAPPTCPPWDPAELVQQDGIEKTLQLVITSGLVKRKSFLDALQERLAPALKKAGPVLLRSARAVLHAVPKLCSHAALCFSHMRCIAWTLVPSDRGPFWAGPQFGVR